MEGVMQAKGELLQTLAPNGLAILNADDPYLLQLAERSDRPVLFFGLSDRARIRALNIATRAAGITFTLVLPGEQVPIELQTHGRFMVGNALAAAAVGHQIGLSAQSIKSGLEAFRPVTGRLNICQTPTGVNLIDDTYNANPGSMRAAIETLQALKGNHQGVLVAGDMLELGNQAKRLHMEIGAWAADHATDRLYITGAFAPQVAAGAQGRGLAAAAIYIGSKQDILSALRAQLHPGDWVLVKGSRGMRMETIVQGLLAQTAAQAAPRRSDS
jgi:UDP-N-acetylmuramyl pentapeptide synthase